MRINYKIYKNNIDEFPEQCVIEFKKPGTKTYILYDPTYMKKKSRLKAMCAFRSQNFGELWDIECD